MSDTKVNITVNGKVHEVEKGRWLIDVLNELGCEIPHFCYHPGLGPDGNCRMCQVEYVTDRGSRLAISCNQPVTDGLNIVTDSDAVKEARAGVEEALLLNHPLDCPICDKAGECTLQNYYMDHDLKDSRQEFTRFKKDKALDIGPTLVLDQERCVLCDRCVRFLRDWAGDEQLYIAGRGHEAYLTPFPGVPVDSPYSLNTYDLCPVGALTSKDFRFTIPTWFLKRTPSTCTTCARGCSIFVDSKDQTIYRLRPRHNPDVNGHWMCDEGRVNYKFVNNDRIKDAIVTRDGAKIASSLENGMADLRALLGIGEDAEGSAPRRVVVVASAMCTLEELFVLKQLVGALSDGALFVARHVADGEEDHLLRRADRHANLRGAELLGVPIADVREGADKDALPSVEGAALFAVGFDYGVSGVFETLLQRSERVAAIAARETAVSQTASVVVPGLTFAERDGLIVNFEGHVQQISPALDNLWDRTPTWRILTDLVEAAGGETGYDSIGGLRTRLMEAEAVFGTGVNLNAVGSTGIRLQGQTV